MSDYCTAKDICEQHIKRANEKKKKLAAMDYKKSHSKARNIFSIPMPIKRVKASDDFSFERVGAGKYQKRYA